MSILNVYIVEDDKKTCEEYIESAKDFPNIRVTGYTSDSRQALIDIKKSNPEAIILDLELQDGFGSGLELLMGLSKVRNYRKPFILICTNNISQSTQNIARKYGADYVISKQQNDYSASLPFEFLNLIRDSIYENMHPGTVPTILDISDDMRIQLIQQELYNLGINPRHKGYKYLVDGIFLSLTTEIETISDICNELAAKYNKNVATIEHSMQNCINYCWLHSDIDNLLDKYTALVDSKRTTPTKKEFIEFYKNKFKTHEYFT